MMRLYEAGVKARFIPDNCHCFPLSSTDSLTVAARLETVRESVQSLTYDGPELRELLGARVD
jgi:hypothetical protein